MNKDYTIQQLKDMSYEKYLETDYWKDVREKVYKRDNNRCRICNSKEKICVHHRTYEFRGEEKLEELITMCNKCHHAFHKTHDLNNKTDKKLREVNILIDKFNKILEDNMNDFETINKRVMENNYIYFSEFKEFIFKYIHKEDTIIKNKFISFCLKCCNMVHVDTYFDNASDRFGLPPKSKHGKTKEIVIKKQLYECDKNAFRLSYYNFKTFN